MKNLTTLSLVVRFLVSAITSPWSRPNKKELDQAARWKEMFTPGTEFLGKDIRYAVNRAGCYTAFGGMDHGQDAAQWRAANQVVELWFQDGRCTSVSVR
jgi:hypothetical protein